jgi:predicted nucleic acid-binding protein
LTTFVDTTAFYALLDPSDDFHERALSFASSVDAADLVTHNYIVVESIALAHGRLGPAQVRELRDSALRSIEVRWVDAAVHERALASLVAAARRRPSFVDWVSFELMRRDGIRTAFAFDRDFALQGFETVP